VPANERQGGVGLGNPEEERPPAGEGIVRMGADAGNFKGITPVNAENVAQGILARNHKGKEILPDPIMNQGRLRPQDLPKYLPEVGQILHLHAFTRILNQTGKRCLTLLFVEFP
jgi:hypothetical protein